MHNHDFDNVTILGIYFNKEKAVEHAKKSAKIVSQYTNTPIEECDDINCGVFFNDTVYALQTGDNIREYKHYYVIVEHINN